MERIYNVNLGLSGRAKKILKEKINSSIEPFTISRTGPSKSIPIKGYHLKDGSVAEEFIQNVSTNDEGQNLYFMGIKISGNHYVWYASEMTEIINQNVYE